MTLIVYLVLYTPISTPMDVEKHCFTYNSVDFEQKNRKFKTIALVSGQKRVDLCEGIFLT